MILVDYACPRCGTFETFVRSPIPAERECGRCGAPAARRFSGVALGGTARRPTDVVAASRRADALVPGLCAAPPEARRSVVARYTGDVDTLASEQRKQRERLERSGPPATTGAGCSGGSAARSSALG